MKRIIASVKLAPGNRGYFDPLTGMNLSLSNNIGYVREGDKVDNIRRDIKDGKIKIVGGKLPPAVNIEQKPVKEEPVKEEPVKEKVQKKAKVAAVKPEPKKEEIVKEEKKKVERFPFPKKEKEIKVDLPAEITINVNDKNELEQASEQEKKDGE